MIESRAMKPMAQLFDAAFSSSFPWGEEPQVRLAASPKTRLRLWEMPTAWHCPLIGTCLSVDELRHQVRKAGFGSPAMSDYVLHAMVVEQCSARTPVAEVLNQYFDQRFALAVKRFARVCGGDAVVALWREAIEEGDVAESLWAAWTHPDLREDDGTAIYGDLHMLSHRVAALNRGQAGRLRQLTCENAALKDELGMAREARQSAHRSREQKIRELEQCLAESERQRVLSQRDATLVASAHELRADNGALRERIAILGEKLGALEAQNALLLKQQAELMQRSGAHEVTCAAVVATGAEAVEEMPEAAPMPIGPGLRGKRILCIGGRTGLVDHYRRAVESAGAQFMHHDGGLEDGDHRIDSLVAAAEVVICLVGHLSHPASWRIKAACKQRQLPCLFARSSGVTGLQRLLAQLAERPVGAASFAARSAGPGTGGC